MDILGIETSCDETAAAVVRYRDGQATVLSSLVLSQLEDHRIFGGVVPEIAARAHMDHLDTLIKAALDDAGLSFDALNGVAATAGPGLIGGVMVGMMAGKAIAAAGKLPFVAVNHLEAHVLTARLTDQIAFPYLVLLVSGGHTQILIAENVGCYKRLGTTLDDALGECFDKSAKLMGLPYPGGPNLEKMALLCKNAAAALERFPLPRPMTGRADCDLSFSGLKTAVRTHVDALPAGPLNPDDVADLSYATQQAICDILHERCGQAMTVFFAEYGHKTGPSPTFVVCGGVAANQAVRRTLAALAEQKNMAFVAPPLNLCSDNAAMIAWTGIERMRKQMTDSLDVAARPRWPLDGDPHPQSGVNASIKA